MISSARRTAARSEPRRAVKVTVLRAWPRRHEGIELDLPGGACVSDALRAAGLEALPEVSGYAIFGVNAAPGSVLQEGDRIELLRPLVVDPKEARRRRAKAFKP